MWDVFFLAAYNSFIPCPSAQKNAGKQMLFVLSNDNLNICTEIYFLPIKSNRFIISLKEMPHSLKIPFGYTLTKRKIYLEDFKHLLLSKIPNVLTS